MTDSEMLDWLEKQEGYGLISDDFGRWAVATAGMQNVPDDTDVASDISSMFFIEAAEWLPSVREAIQSAMGSRSPQESGGMTPIPEDIANLCARLRRAHDMQEGRGGRLFNEAADTIEALMGDNVHLREQMETYRGLAQEREEAHG